MIISLKVRASLSHTHHTISQTHTRISLVDILDAAHHKKGPFRFDKVVLTFRDAHQVKAARCLFVALHEHNPPRIAIACDRTRLVCTTMTRRRSSHGSSGMWLPNSTND